MSVEREMTLQEWVERLPPIHAARKEYERLIAQKSEPYEYLQETVKELKAMSDHWEEAARRHCSNEFFYRELLNRCAAHIGPEVYISDDGSVQDEPLRLKVPELVKRLAAERDALRELMREIAEVVDSAQELNMCNYDHEQVHQLNNALIEIYQLLPAPPTEEIAQ